MQQASDYTYPTFTGRGPAHGKRTYVIDEEKAKIVDFAIKLGRPLLVEGEAGCGKTKLASAIAAELDLGEVIVASVRSTSRASDLLYRFDAIRRLQDSQIARQEVIDKAASAYNYVQLQPLGEAIFRGRPSVILIDEVDKGDLDFPNDLLHVLDTFEFHIDEIPQSEGEAARRVLGFDSTVRGSGVRPIVLFTSNREKQLPKPFLRRCLYLELTFPSNPADLETIVVSNLAQRRGGDGHGGLAELSTDIVQAAVRSFLKIREQAERSRAFKLPATAELIDWVHILHWEGTSAETIEGQVPPYWETLFSTAKDIESHARVLAAHGGS